MKTENKIIISVIMIFVLFAVSYFVQGDMLITKKEDYNGNSYLDLKPVIGMTTPPHGSILIKDTDDNRTLVSTEILTADEFYTESLTIDDKTDYTIKYLDTEALTTKELHKNYVELTDSNGVTEGRLSVEGRIIDLEGYDSNEMRCLATYDTFVSYRSCMLGLSTKE